MTEAVSRAPAPRRGGRALVAGAGIGGLAAAAALARSFDEVVIYEKDQLPVRAEIRSGAIQGAHIHTMLRGGEGALEKLMPGIRAAFIAAGAVVLDMGEDYIAFDQGVRRVQRNLDMPILMMSRPGYEGAIRGYLQTIDNISIRSGVRVEAITMGEGSTSALSVDDGAGRRDVPGDLIIDARGRGSALPAELAANNYGGVPETALGILMCYVSGRFKLKHAQLHSKTAMLVRPDPPNCRYGIVFPIEGGDWIITLGGRKDIVPPTDIDGFFTYARELGAPEFSQFIEDGALIDKLWRYKKPSANWRHYDRMPSFPRRLVPVGDAITSINPTFGQGMTVSVFHAVALASTLANLDPADEGFQRAYFAQAMAASDSAWQLAASTDLQYPFVSGERPVGFEQSVAFSRGLRLLAGEDPSVLRLVMEVFHLERSSACLRDEAIVSRVMSKLAENNK